MPEVFATRGLAAVAAFATLLCSPGATIQGQTAPGAGQARPESFSEKVLVREIEVVVELPDSVRESRRKSLGPQDFQVLEDGSSRQVVKATPVASGDAGAWQVVLYVDRVLASPETVFFTANNLAQHASRLTDLGSVDVVVADPQPRVVLAGSREPKALAQVLTELAAQAERQRDAKRPAQPAAGGGSMQDKGSASWPKTTPVVGPEPPAVRRQEDRLVAMIAGRSGGGPRAMLLVADGFDTSSSGDGATSATAAIAEEPARTLAAYGWITIAAPMRRQELGVEHREITDLERIRQSSAGGTGSSVPPEILPQGAPRSRLAYDGVLSLFVEPASATLTAIASATAGTVIGFPSQLAAVLANLTRRWHLFYLAPDPEDGRPRPVEVRLLPDGLVLRAPVWRRSSTPDEVAAARLRRVLDGSPDHGTLALTATAGQPDARSLRLAVGAFTTPDAIPAGPFRVSLASAGPSIPTPTVRHRLMSRADFTEKGWSDTLSLDIPAGARWVGVAVEDLNHQLWGATTVNLPPAPQPTVH